MPIDGPAQARSLLRHMAVETVADALEAADVPWAALKGMDVAHRAYPHPSQREMADIDLLIDPTQMEAIHETVTAAGLRPIHSTARHEHCYRWFFSTDGPSVLIELHVDLFEPPHGIRVTPAELLARRTHIQLPSGRQLPVLAPEDAWNVVAGHFAYTNLGAGPVNRALDDLTLLQVATNVRPEAVLARAREWGILGSYQTVFQAVADVRPLPSDPVFEAILASPPVGPRWSQYLARRWVRRRVRQALADEKIGGAWSILRGLLAPRRGVALQMVVDMFDRRRAHRAALRAAARWRPAE